MDQVTASLALRSLGLLATLCWIMVVRDCRLAWQLVAVCWMEVWALLMAWRGGDEVGIWGGEGPEVVAHNLKMCAGGAVRKVWACLSFPPPCLEARVEECLDVLGGLRVQRVGQFLGDRRGAGRECGASEFPHAEMHCQHEGAQARKLG